MTEWNAEVAEWYAAKYGEYATNRLAVDAIDVRPDAVVVDIGCGTGSALRRIAPRVPEGRLLGLDPVPRMVAIATERAADDPNGQRIEFREGSAEELPLDDGSVDLVLAFDSIDHWKDRAAGLREVTRVLRPTGRVVMVKDGGLPGCSEAGRRFLGDLEDGDLIVEREERLAEGDVVCILWVGRPR